MIAKDQIINKLELPAISQIGMVVRDLEKVINYYEGVLGLGPFVKPKIIFTERYYYGNLVESKWIMGFCSLGSVELEIIQPIAGPTVYHDFLKEKGEGLHHLGFDVNDIEKKIDICQNLNIQVIQNGKGPDASFAYLDTEKIGGVVFELIQRKGRRI
jgi:catechol 2,3-dioxygenase-like lactoylglutathione lyase family enzyme